MAFLTPDKKLKVTLAGKSIIINQKIIPDTMVAPKDVASWCKKGQPMKPRTKVNDGTGNPRGITVHNTAASSVSSATTIAETYTRSTYNGNMSGAIVSYYVGGYNDIWQMLNTEPGSAEQGWHAGDGVDPKNRKAAHSGSKYSTIGGNLDTISIECIGNTAEAEDATAILVAYLCKKHGLNPLIDVYTHNFFMDQPDKIVNGVRKNCPVYILPHWSKFLSTANKYYVGNVSTQTTTQSTTKSTTTKNTVYRIRKTWADTKSQVGAFVDIELAKKYLKDGYSIFDGNGKKVYPT